jgi:RecA-family ATPase
MDETMKPAAALIPPAPDAPATLEQIGRWSSSFVGPPPEREYLLRHPNGGFMPAGKLCLLASPGGKGKTALLMHLAVHVAAGRSWLGLEVVKPGAVVMVLGEEDAEEVHRRLNASCDGLPPPPNVLVLPLAGHGSRRLVDDQGTTQHFTALKDYLVKSAPDGGWRLVIVDPFARFAGPEAETDNAEATRTMEALEELVKLPGSPVVFVTHHTKKRGGDDLLDAVELIRGASAIKDAARWAAMLESQEPDEGGTARAWLRIVKTNYTTSAYAVDFKMARGVPAQGKVRLWKELAAELAPAPKERPSKSGGNTAAGAVANERRIPEGVK